MIFFITSVPDFQHLVVECLALIDPLLEPYLQSYLSVAFAMVTKD